LGAKKNIAAQTERIEFLFSQIMRGIFRFDSKACGRRHRKGMDFTLAQLRVMRLVSRHENCRMNELARMAGISMPTLTGIVDRLVRAGILARERDPNDRRAVRVHFTPKGKDMRDRHRRFRVERIGEMLKRLNSGERGELARSMEKTYSIVSKLASEYNGPSGASD
jgi:DNA-binding MarR family transcriptional regulator